VDMLNLLAHLLLPLPGRATSGRTVRPSTPHRCALCVTIARDEIANLQKAPEKPRKKI